MKLVAGPGLGQPTVRCCVLQHNKAWFALDHPDCWMKRGTVQTHEMRTTARAPPAERSRRRTTGGSAPPNVNITHVPYSGGAPAASPSAAQAVMHSLLSQPMPPRLSLRDPRGSGTWPDFLLVTYITGRPQRHSRVQPFQF